MIYNVFVMEKDKMDTKETKSKKKLGRPPGSKNGKSKNGGGRPKGVLAKKYIKMGRPEKSVDYKILAELCHIQCTGLECASVLGMDYASLERHVRKETGKTFSEYWEEKAAGGRKSLRRKQWDVAQSGDKTLLIWLGKQYLGQTDKRQIESTGKLEHSFSETEASLKDMSQEELFVIRGLLARIEEKKKVKDAEKPQKKYYKKPKPKK